MQSIRVTQPDDFAARVLPLFVAAAVIATLTVLAPAALAGSQQDFYLAKTCAEDSSEPLGYICTVQHSDFKWIPPGTEIHYAAIPTLDPDAVQAATIIVSNGSATGVCDWRNPAGPVLATCTFGAGSGRLTQFHLVVEVTTDPSDVWYWNGSYWFGG